MPHNWVLQGCSSSSRSVQKKKTNKKILAAAKKKEKKRRRCPHPVVDSPFFFPNCTNTMEERDIDEDDERYDDDRLYRHPTEKYSDELNKVKLLKIVKGKPLEEGGVYKLLSNTGKDKGESYLVRNNGEKVSLIEAIKCKYLIICCFYVPVLSDFEDGGVCRSLIATYNELKEKKKVSIEMVMVAKMRTAYIAEDEEEPAFNSFFSAFPCLAVPFSDSSSRNLICKRLGLGTGQFRDACFVLDPHQNVLQKDSECFTEYGAASFPFTEDQLNSIKRKDDELRFRLDPIYKERNWFGDSHHPIFGFTADELREPVRLNELLCCDDEPLEKCDGSGEEVTVSELSEKKCVGLYLCYNGNLMNKLHKIQRKCVDEDKREFEIVLVSMRSCSDNPLSYSKSLDLALKKKNIRSWWVLPFVDQVSRRLLRLYLTIGDSLIIWANGGTSGELAGKAFIKRFGSDADAYPLTTKNLLDNRVSAVRSLTLDSFLDENQRLVPGYSSKQVKRVSHLKKRNVLLYFASSSNFNPCFHKQFCAFYEKIKNNCQVVFVPMDYQLSFNDLVDKVPWPRLPSIPIAPSYPKFLGLGQVSFIAFGADKQIKSIRYKEDVVSMFDDNLRDEILDELIDKYCDGDQD